MLQKPRKSQLHNSFLTNRTRNFHNTCLYENGLSDFHKLVGTILRTGFEPVPPKKIKY